MLPLTGHAHASSLQHLHPSQNFVDLSQPRTQRFWESHKPLTKGRQEQGDVWSEKQPNPRGSNVLAVGRDECRGIRGRTKVILAILVHQVVRGTVEIRRRRRRRKRRRRRSPPRPLSWQETKTKKGSEKHSSPSCADPLLSPHERVDLELDILAVSSICQSKWMLKICRATNPIFMTDLCQHCHHQKAYRYNHVALIIWAAGEAQAPKTFTHSAFEDGPCHCHLGPL